MEVSKVVAVLICYLLLKFTLSAPVTSKELVQKLEERVEELTEILKLLKSETFHHTKRQATTCILNGNRKLKYLSKSLA